MSLGAAPNRHDRRVLDARFRRSGLTYTDTVKAFGRVMGLPQVTAAAGKRSPLVDRVQHVAAVAGRLATATPRARWHGALASIIGEGPAVETRALANATGGTRDAWCGGLGVVLLAGALEDKQGSRTEHVAAWRRANAFFDGMRMVAKAHERAAEASLQPARANAYVPRGLAGPGRSRGPGSLGGLGYWIDNHIGEFQNLFPWAYGKCGCGDTRYCTGPMSYNNRVAMIFMNFKEVYGRAPTKPEIAAWAPTRWGCSDATMKGGMQTARAAGSGVPVGLGVEGRGETESDGWWMANFSRFPRGLFEWSFLGSECSCFGDTAPKFKCGLPFPVPTAGQVNYYDRIRQVHLNFGRVTGAAPDNAEIAAWGPEDRGCSDTTMRASMSRIWNATGHARPLLPDDTARTIVHENVFAEAGNWIKENLGAAVDMVVAELKKSMQQSRDILCRVFKKLFGESVGGTLCEIITVAISIVGALVQTVIAIVKALIMGLVGLLVNLVQGKFLDAVKALLTAINTIVLLLLGSLFAGPLNIPVLTSQKSVAQQVQGIKSLEEMGESLGFMFTITIVSSIVTLVLSGFTAVTAWAALIVALAPAFGLILGPQVPRIAAELGIEDLKGKTQEQYAKLIEFIVKWTGALIVGIAAIKDLVQKAVNGAKSILARAPETNKAGYGNRIVDQLKKNFVPVVTKLEKIARKFEFGSFLKTLKDMIILTPLVLVCLMQLDDDLADVTAPLEQVLNTAASQWDGLETQVKATLTKPPPEATHIDIGRKARGIFDEANAELTRLCTAHPGAEYCPLPGAPAGASGGSAGGTSPGTTTPGSAAPGVAAPDVPIGQSVPGVAMRFPGPDGAVVPGEKAVQINAAYGLLWKRPPSTGLLARMTREPVSTKSGAFGLVRQVRFAPWNAPLFGTRLDRRFGIAHAVMAFAGRAPLDAEIDALEKDAALADAGRPDAPDLNALVQRRILPTERRVADAFRLVFKREPQNADRAIWSLWALSNPGANDAALAAGMRSGQQVAGATLTTAQAAKPGTFGRVLALGGGGFLVGGPVGAAIGVAAALRAGT